MTWFAVDDRFPTHSKAYELRQYSCHDAALAMWLLAGSWCCGQQGHDMTGFVPKHMIHAFGISEPQEAAQALVDVLLWEVSGDGFKFHDWTHWNGPDAKHIRSREQTRERKQAHRIRICEEAGDDLTLHNSECPTMDLDGRPRSCPRREAKELGKPLPNPPRPDPQSRDLVGHAQEDASSTFPNDVTPSHVTDRDGDARWGVAAS